MFCSYYEEAIVVYLAVRPTPLYSPMKLDRDNMDTAGELWSVNLLFTYVTFIYTINDSTIQHDSRENIYCVVLIHHLRGIEYQFCYI